MPPRLRGIVFLACAIASGTLAMSSCDDSSQPTTPVEDPTPTIYVGVNAVTLRWIGARDTVHVLVTDQNGVPATGLRRQWSSADESIVTVDSAGVVTAKRVGTTDVTLRIGKSSATVSVRVVQRVAVLALPDTAIAFVGRQRELSVSARDSGGSLIPNPVVRWASSDTSILAIDNNSGQLSARAAGLVTVTATADERVSAGTRVEVPAEMVGAGDIARCPTPGIIRNDHNTAALLDTLPGIVFTLGDNVYEAGTLDEFNRCYHPTWGRQKARTKPVAGNHDWYTEGAAGYLAYFGPVAGSTNTLYYSFVVGSWKIIVLDSYIPRSLMPIQLAWLRTQLSNDPKLCTAALWHHPFFSPDTQDAWDAQSGLFWEILYEYGADLILGGHDHLYERTAPQTPTGQRDDVRGIRQFIVGTGGSGFGSFKKIHANSQVRNADTHGVLKLTLYHDAYEWRFVPIAGRNFTDSGRTACH